MRSRHGHGRSIHRSTDKFRLRRKEEEEARSPSLPPSGQSGEMAPTPHHSRFGPWTDRPAPFPPRRPSFSYLRLSAHVLSRSPLRNYKPDDATAAAAAVATALSMFTEFSIFCFDMCGQHRKKEGFSRPTLSSLNPFPPLLFCSLFPGASSVRLSDRARRGRSSGRASQRATAAPLPTWAAGDGRAAATPASASPPAAEPAAPGPVACPTS